MGDQHALGLGESILRLDEHPLASTLVAILLTTLWRKLACLIQHTGLSNPCRLGVDP